MASGALASLAEQTGRTELLPELARPAPEPLPQPAPAVAALFNEARSQADRSPVSAARTIEKALKQAPDDVACLTLAVMIFTLSGKRARAEYFGRRGAALAPSVPAVHINLGNCLRDQQKYEEALACYRTALELAPQLIQTIFNLAQCLSQLNRPAEARDFYLQALSVKATTVPEKICQASALLTLDRLAEAERLLDSLLSEAPSHAQALMDLASVYRRTRRHEQAEALLDRLRAEQPGNALVLTNISGLYHEMHRYDDALAAARKAHALHPQEPGAMLAIANACSALGLLAEAERFALDAGARGRGRPLGTLALIHEQQGRYDEAIAIMEAVCAQEPEKGWPHFTLALALLRRGDFQRGWRELEWRWKWDQNPEIPRHQDKPVWTLQARKGKVLLWSEQGLGDSLQFLRYVPKLIEAGFQPIVEIQPPLARLARASLPCPVVARGETLPPFDYQIPFLSLPLALGTTDLSIPSPGPYLKAVAGAPPQWHKDDRLTVGLCWAGNPKHGRDNFRSLSLKQLAPLFDLDGVRFISVQKSLRAEDERDLAEFGARLETGWIGSCSDFAESAALIDCLDLVISVDTAIVHLAGGLGKRTWLMLPFCPDWRWLTGRDDSIWYESARLFRQDSQGGWEPVLRRIADEVKLLARTRAI